MPSPLLFDSPLKRLGRRYTNILIKNVVLDVGRLQHDVPQPAYDCALRESPTAGKAIAVIRERLLTQQVHGTGCSRSRFDAVAS